MKNRLANAAVLLAVTSLTVGYCAAQDADQPQPDEKPGRQEEKGGEKRPQKTPAGGLGTMRGMFAFDLDALKTTVGLAEQQVQKIAALREKRDAALAKWDEANAERKAELKKKALMAPYPHGVAKARRELEAYLKAEKAARARLAAPYDRQMFAVLTREQRGKYNAPILRTAVIREFHSPALSGEQDKKLQALCEKTGASQPMPVPPETGAPQLNSLYKQVYQQVLTPRQRESYATAKKEELARKREEEAKKKGAGKKKKKK